MRPAYKIFCGSMSDEVHLGFLRMEDALVHKETMNKLLDNWNPDQWNMSYWKTKPEPWIITDKN